MAVSTTNAYDGPFSANGVTLSFPFTFTAQATGDVAVLLDDQPITEGYTVELYEGGGGTVNFAEAPGPGKLVVWLDPEFTQTTAFENGSAWLAAPVNLANDRAALRDQALSRDLKRCMRIPLGENSGTLPAAAKRKGKYLAFSSVDGSASLVDAVTTDSLLRADVASTDTNKGAVLVGMVGGGTVQDHIDRTTLSSVAALLASTKSPRGAGTRWRAGVFDYVEAASNATDHHVITAGGVKLYAQPQGRTVWAEQFGAVADGVTNCLAQIQKAVTTGYDVIFGAGTFNIGSGYITPASENQTLAGGMLGATILFSGSKAIYSRVAQGLTGPAMFSTFASNIKFQRLGFRRASFSTSAQAIRMINVRGLYVEDCEFANCSLLYVTMEAEENGTYDRTSNAGVTTIDPAVTAGWNATEPNDLNEHVYVRRNRGLNTRYGCQGIRLNWVRYFEVSGNTLPYGNISWWGGGARQDQGGDVAFLRRVAYGRIFGNYCSWNNGAIYGNNGTHILVSKNNVECSLDTAIDFEGCFHCTAAHNTIAHFGNFATSTFYASINNMFTGNVISVTLQGASLSAAVGLTTYMNATTVTGLADNGDGTTSVTLATPADIQTGQLVLIPSLTGGVKTPVAITRVSSTVYKVPLAYDAAWTTDGSFYYQTGRTYFQAISGFPVATTGKVQGEVSFVSNTVTANDGLVGHCNDGPLDTVVVSNNRLTNCAIRLTYVIAGSKIVENNILKFKYATLPALSSCEMIDVRGYVDQCSVSYNTIVVADSLPWVPSGCHAINVAASRFAIGQMQVKIEGNVIQRTSASAVAGGIAHSTQNTSAQGAVARIVNNHVPAISELSPPGACQTTFSGNIETVTGASLDRLVVAPANGATVTMTPATRALYLNHAATIATLTIALPLDPADEAGFRIVSRSAVTALSVTNSTTGAPATYGTAPTALTAGQTVRLTYSKSQNAWIWG